VIYEWVHFLLAIFIVLFEEVRVAVQVLGEASSSNNVKGEAAQDLLQREVFLLLRVALDYLTQQS